MIRSPGSQEPGVRLSKIPCGAFRQEFTVCCAHNSYTCSLIGIFCQVHALTENVFEFLCRESGKLCEAFYTVWTSPAGEVF